MTGEYEAKLRTIAKPFEWFLCFVSGISGVYMHVSCGKVQVSVMLDVLKIIGKTHAANFVSSPILLFVISSLYHKNFPNY